MSLTQARATHVIMVSQVAFMLVSALAKDFPSNSLQLNVHDISLIGRVRFFMLFFDLRLCEVGGVLTLSDRRVERRSSFRILTKHLTRSRTTKMKVLNP